MKNKRYNNSKSTKFVRVDNNTWIEADEWIPDEVARMQFLQRMQLAKPADFSGQAKNNNSVIGS